MDMNKADNGQEISILNTEELTISRVEWNQSVTGYAKFRVYFKRRSGQEVYSDSRIDFVREYHPGQYYYPLSSSFYQKDPRQQFPNWSELTWRKIERQQITTGMTREMASLSCAGNLRVGQADSRMVRGKLSVIFECGETTFTFINDKVVVLAK